MVLCTDSHVSYKGFAIDNRLERHPLRTDLKQYTKQGKYHIQHVNSLHSKVKSWLQSRFEGVATKYLQNYMNWYRMKQMLKSSGNFLQDFIEKSLEDTTAYNRYRNIEEKYKKLLITTQS